MLKRKRTYGSRRRKSLKTNLSLLCFLCLVGCGSQVPDFPDVYQCQWNGNPRAFYCINVKTKARVKIDADHPHMKGAQCLSADDYKQSEAWVGAVKAIAEKRCK